MTQSLPQTPGVRVMPRSRYTHSPATAGHQKNADRYLFYVTPPARNSRLMIRARCPPDYWEEVFFFIGQVAVEAAQQGAPVALQAGLFFIGQFFCAP